MSHERLKPEYLFDEEKLNELKKIAPECFEDGKINFQTLRQNLGDWVQDDDEDSEHFGLNWPGKKEARKMASLPPQGTLEPLFGEGLKADGTPDSDGANDSKNIFIEGENLEVLKILQKSYAGRIKMIYIDPPYNTGNDFVYEDDFSEPLQEYFRRTGQIDEEGKQLTSNKKSDGRFHSKWLTMIYPRLRIARNLLKEDGIIFISIDDNEVFNLRMLCNEIFGEENFIEQIIWKNKYGAGAQTKGVISVHEYILCYSKNPIQNLDSPLSEEAKKSYNKKDEKYDLRGGFFTQPLMTNSLGDRENLTYSILYKNEEIKPRKQWVWSEERLLEAIEKNEVVFNKQKDGNYSVRAKQYLKNEDGSERKGKPLSVLIGPYTQEGTTDIVSLFGFNPFGFVKPVKLIEYLLSFSVNSHEEEEEIYLDFFSGSGTTCQSILNLNKKDNRKRRYIAIQWPESINENDSNGKKAIKYLNDKNKPHFISELTKERLRLINQKESIPSGFNSFKLKKSNFKKWKNIITQDILQLESTIDLFNQSPLVPDWTHSGLLTEIILNEGFDLSCAKSVINDFKPNTIFRISDSNCKHSLLVCLDEKIDSETINQLKLTGNDIFICLDSAISNVEKLRLSDKGMIKTI